MESWAEERAKLLRQRAELVREADMLRRIGKRLAAEVDWERVDGADGSMFRLDVLRNDCLASGLLELP